MDSKVKISKYNDLTYLHNKDPAQVRFNDNGWMIKTEPPKAEPPASLNSNEQVMCPFCLYQNKLSHFFVSVKKGISSGKAFCPECKNGMLMRTLLADMTATQYAKFVWDYRTSGFWKKCPFDVWKQRLHGVGWSHEFWEEYKRLKAQFSSDSIFDDADKMARDYGIDVNEGKQ